MSFSRLNISISASGGSRTHTPSRELDFESSASANSATEAVNQAKGGNRIWTDD